MNSKGDRTQPCLTPDVIWNQLVVPTLVGTNRAVTAPVHSTHTSSNGPFMPYSSRTPQTDMSVNSIESIFFQKTRRQIKARRELDRYII